MRYDREFLGFLGRCGLEMGEGGQVVSRRLLNAEEKEAAISNLEEVKAALRYLRDGEEKGGNHLAIGTLKKLARVEVPDGPAMPMTGTYKYDEFILDWEGREVEAVSTPDAEMREIPLRKSGLSIFYPYDPELTRGERECQDVLFWFVEWDKRRVHTLKGAMSDAPLIRSTLVPFLRGMGGIDGAMDWVAAKAAYEAGRPQFTPLS